MLLLPAFQKEEWLAQGVWLYCGLYSAGTEAIFADLGHFTFQSIQVSYIVGCHSSM
jgi:K+ transporter